MDRNSLCRALGLVALSCVLLCGAGIASASTITMQTVPVGNVGNAPDPATGFGEVDYAYNIGTYDVTVTQYVAFLNAVAQTDTYGVYNQYMATDTTYGCGIVQTGSSGNYAYAATKNGNFPVNYVSWGDAARFCNWLTNGQPSGAEGNGTTETGLYTLNGATTVAQLTAITRNTGAGYAIPTENEWYKAAYYDPSLNGGAGGYWTYPTKSNTAPNNSLALAPTEANDANYYINGYTDPKNYLTAVGTFAATPGPYGTFDQCGDVYQWNEAIVDYSYRGLRGGAFNFTDIYLQSDYEYIYVSQAYGYYMIGLRVSEVPEPTSLALLAFGVTGLLVRRKNTRR
jgi:formylglycine-generating enzyme required for sulfatase activity